MSTSHAPRRGFTIVELLIVIVVIGVLAGISIVAYTGIQKRARTASYTSSLAHISKLMEVEKIESDGSYPASLPEHIQKAGSPNTVRLVSGTPVYANLSSVQQGVLFQDICTNLIAEGYGSGVNEGDQAEQYITNCNVYGNGAIQLNGWHAQSFTVPISATTIHDWFNTNVNDESWRPNKRQIYLEFASQLSNRHTASGGSFPVTSFWDTWAAGVPREDLPSPTSSYDPEAYCIEISHPSRTDEVWHIRQQSKSTEGRCA